MRRLPAAALSLALLPAASSALPRTRQRPTATIRALAQATKAE